jgi:outer membrane protein assembly factor BamA
MSPKTFRAAILLFATFCLAHNLRAQPADSAPHLAPTKKRSSFFEQLLNGNVDRTHEKTVDISFAAMPSYSRESSLLMGGMAAGLYRINRADSVLPPSDLSLFGMVSITKSYSLGLKGNTYFPDKHSLLSYNLVFANQPTDFWGFSYADCAFRPAIDQTCRKILVEADYRYKLLEHFYVGMQLDFTYASITHISDASYLNGQKPTYTTTGIGISVQYDSRDFIPNPRRGSYLMLRQTFYPAPLSNARRLLYRTTFVADTYRRVWTNAVLAVDLFGEINSANAPWHLREQLGGNLRMRGYYKGRYIDNSLIAAQMELRQYVAQRIGFAAWLGAGTVFPSLQAFTPQHLLPTCGVGVRWEFKHNLNLRVDYGFGKQTNGFILSVGEAF